MGDDLSAAIVWGIHLNSQPVIENDPSVIEDREKSWLSYQGDYPIPMVHGQNLFLMPSDEYSKGLFLFRRQHFGLLLGLARISLPFETPNFVIDVGANIGYFSAWAASRSDVNHVFAFEPNGRAFEVLRKNSSDKMHLENLLVSDRAGKDVFSLHLTNSALSGNPIEDRSGNYIDFDLASIDLDTYSTQISARCVVIKVDVEGSEHKVLAGARGLIERDGPVLVVENHSQSDKLRARLEEIRATSAWNYVAYRADGDGFLHSVSISKFDPKWTDIILAPKAYSIRH